MNPLNEHPRTRRVVYTTFWVVALLLGGLQVGFPAAGAEQPVWLNAATAVYVFLAAAVGYTAAKNTHQNAKIEPYEPERGVTGTEG